MYTSGTTGIPKGVLHSHNTLRRSAANSREARGVGEGDITLMASPVTHVTGYSSLEQAFNSPIKTALMSRWDKAAAIDFINRTRSKERRVGKECDSTWKYRWSLKH